METDSIWKYLPLNSGNLFVTAMPGESKSGLLVTRSSIPG
jgi:hypothetical protein